MLKFKALKLNTFLEISKWEDKIFTADHYNFQDLAIEVFRAQYQGNPLYRQFVDSLGVQPLHVTRVEDIPFLPIQFFKARTVATTSFEPELIFESSGTTGDRVSRHFVKKLSLYRESLVRGFQIFYGRPERLCILALLPGYLERQHSSLVAMVAELIRLSGNSNSGFYLNDHEKLYQALVHNEIREQPVLLIGVTYALLAFAETYDLQLRHTTIMETGGMKGKREEITRQQVHGFLTERLGVAPIHSEYGMTELLSQAYSDGNGFFKCPPWMKILIREEDDPLVVQSVPTGEKPLSGLLNIIDLANLYSCAFIATDDVGKLHRNHTFEVLGRRDDSDIRGCSLLTAQ